MLNRAWLNSRLPDLRCAPILPFPHAHPSDLPFVQCPVDRRPLLFCVRRAVRGRCLRGLPIIAHPGREVLPSLRSGGRLSSI